MNAPVNVLNAADDPASMERIQDMIALFRTSLSPLFNAEPDDLPRNQSLTMTAAALMSGITVGHMIALGVLKEGDKAGARKVMTVAYNSGVKLGLHEARQAMLEQLPTDGNA